MNTANIENVFADRTISEEQISKELKQRNRSCCISCCLSSFVCFVVLLSCFVILDAFRSKYYPVGLKGDRNRDDAEEIVRRIKSGTGARDMAWEEVTDVMENWIKEEGKDQLFVGTWQLEDPSAVGFFSFPVRMSGWEKTRLEIHADNTFILTDPCENMDWLHGFCGTLSGTWGSTFSDTDQAIMIFFTQELNVSFSGTNATQIRPQILMTLRKKNTSEKFLRLIPSMYGVEGYFVETSPSWKKVIER